MEHGGQICCCRIRHIIQLLQAFIALKNMLFFSAITKKGIPMRLILAIFFPFIVFFRIRKPIQGLVCLLLQVTMIGWIPAALWAVYALSQYKTDKKIKDFQLSNETKF